MREDTELFRQIPTASSAWVASGSDVEIIGGTFEDGKSYLWQAWTEDTNGATSGMIAFGGAPDFTKTLNNSADQPVSSKQYGLDGVVAIPVGGTTSHQGVILRATLTDPDGDPVRFQVEIQPIGQPFAAVASATSEAVESGSEAEVMIEGLTNRAGYHWRLRVIDSSNETSYWTAFGDNSEMEADFNTDGDYQPPVHAAASSGSSGGCLGSSVSAKSISWMWILALLGGLFLGMGVRRQL